MFFIATFLIFMIVRVLPGDPIQANFGERRVPENLRNAYIERYRLDRNVFVQYWLYMKDIFLGFDFGESLATQRPVTEIFLERLPRSATLAALVVTFEASIGIPLGVITSRNRDGFFDSSVLFVTVGMLAVPTFVVAVFSQLVFGLKLGWFPISGLNDGFKSYLLPAIAVAVSSVATDIRLTRASVVDTYREDYIRTARAKGAGDTRVLGIHALRNALIPVITQLGITLGALLGGLLVTESVFQIPGLGFTIVRAVPARDTPILVGISTMLVIAYLVINLIVDLMYAWLDPRIRYE